MPLYQVYTSQCWWVCICTWADFPWVWSKVSFCLGSGTSAHFEDELFSKRALLLKKYVKDDRKLQLRVLYALQIAVAQLQHPTGEPITIIIIIEGFFEGSHDLPRKATFKEL